MDNDEKLKREIRNMGYRIEVTSGKSNKACHHPDYVVFLRTDKTIEQTYAIAHELGHCIDFKAGNLDFQKYRRDKKYRIKKEIVAWVYALKICKIHNISISVRFFTYAWYCLKSYLKINKGDYKNLIMCTLGIHKFTYGKKGLFKPACNYCLNCGKEK